MSEFALSCYKEVMLADDVMKVGDSILIPKFSEKVLDKIIKSAIKNLFKAKPLIHIIQ